jgi:hypothetical protein
MKKKGQSTSSINEVNGMPLNSGRVNFEVYLRFSNCPKKIRTKECCYMHEREILFFVFGRYGKLFAA